MGTFITGYYAFLGQTRGAGLRADYMISKLGTQGRPGLFFGLFIAGQITDAFGPENYDITFMRVGGGLRKERYLFSNVRVGAGIDAGAFLLTDGEIDDPDNEGRDDIGHTYFIAPNLEMGIHLWHNIQLVGSGRFFLKLATDQGENYVGPIDAASVMANRNGLSIDLGVRYNF